MNTQQTTAPKDTAPKQQTPSLLTDLEVATFARQGFLVVRQLADAATCQALRDIGTQHLQQAIPPLEYEADTQYPGAPSHLEAPGGRTIRRLRQVFARDVAFRNWAMDVRVTERIKQLLDSPFIALSQAHHNSLMTKQPKFSSMTNWHRDIRYWHFANPNLITTWLALGTENQENGCLGFLPATHTLDLPPEAFENLAFLRADLPSNQQLIKQAIYPELAAGDVVFFHAMTFHAAGWNRSNTRKFSLAYTYHRRDNLADINTRSSSLPEIAIS